MNENWSEPELKAAVEAYVDLHRKQPAGIKTNKAELYRQLASRFGRTPSAFERRMANISHVFEL